MKDIFIVRNSFIYLETSPLVFVHFFVLLCFGMFLENLSHVIQPTLELTTQSKLALNS